MPRLNIEHAQVHAAYDPAAATHTAALFETLDDAYDLRRDRARLLNRVPRLKEEGSLARSVRRLARKLSARTVSDSMADPVHWRDIRLRVGSAVWRFLDQPDVRGVARFVTIVPRDAQYHGDAPIPFDPERLKLRLRSALYRCGAREADGFLVLWLEGAYDMRSGIGQMHWHGFVGGGMIDVMDRLRETNKYRSERKSSPRPKFRSNLGARVVNPIQISEGLVRLPTPILYCMKESWWARPLLASGASGDRSPYSGRGKHMPGLVEAYSLLWRDRWSLSDITLMMGMYMGTEGLALSI